MINEASSVKRLRIFDFDDTLVMTDARILVTDANGKEFTLTPGEFAVYDQQPGDIFDYSEFDDLINPRVITWTAKILQNVYDKYGAEGLVILTARGTSKPVTQFLSDIGLHDIEVKALGDADPKMKAKWIDRWITERGLEYVEFFDDSHKNIAAVRELKHLHPGVHVVVRHVVHTHVPTHGYSKHYGTRQASKVSA